MQRCRVNYSHCRSRSSSSLDSQAQRGLVKLQQSRSSQRMFAWQEACCLSFWIEYYEEATRLNLWDGDGVTCE